MMRIVIAIVFTLMFCSLSFAQVGLPFPGPGGVAVTEFAKILVTGDGKVLVTGDGKFLRSPGTENWEKLLKTSDDKLLVTGDGKVLKTP